jgi:hypothetical protein
MALWDKLSTELRSAGKAARGAIDEGKLRLELFRIRQLADKAAQALGYAVYQAHQSGAEPAPDAIRRLEATLAEHDAAAKKLEAALAENTEGPKTEDRTPNI